MLPPLIIQLYSMLQFIVYVSENKHYMICGIIAGEWWNAITEAVMSQALQTGGGPNVSDAYTINGLPGLLYNCSAKGISYMHASFVLISLTDRM